jgi:hypothetical protein
MTQPIKKYKCGHVGLLTKAAQIADTEKGTNKSVDEHHYTTHKIGGQISEGKISPIRQTSNKIGR